MSFFVALIHPKTSWPIPLVDDNGSVIMFQTARDADEAMQKNEQASAWGYNVIAWRHVSLAINNDGSAIFALPTISTDSGKCGMCSGYQCGCVPDN